MTAFYQTSLDWVLVHKRITLASFAASLILVALLFMLVPKGFLPSGDTGMIIANTQAAEDIGFTAMVNKQQQIAKIIQAHPAVASLMSSVDDSNEGRLIIRLKARDERQTIDNVIQELRKQTRGIPGMQVFLRATPPLSIGGKMSKSNYQYTLQSTDSSLLDRKSVV